MISNRPATSMENAVATRFTHAAKPTLKQLLSAIAAS
jgi:hypothetical protein